MNQVSPSAAREATTPAQKKNISNNLDRKRARARDRAAAEQEQQQR
jgi:hypothetical protein